MIVVAIYVGLCVAFGTAFGLYALDERGRSPILLASIFVATAWPAVIFAVLYIAIDDRVMSMRHRNKKRAPS